MKLVLAILIAGLLIAAGVQQASPPEQLIYGNSEATTQGCKIAKVNSLGLPELELVLNESAPAKTEKAYFSMGCFWGSEAMLASCPGVLHTRTGFTGGQTPNPSYSAIADHVETVEVTFDPALTSFEQLLDHFWDHHNARAKPIFRQYASAIFTTSKIQTIEAKSARSQRQTEGGSDPILTAVIPLQKFYPAEAYHQKYYLQQDTELAKLLPGSDKYSTQLATKLNALAGRAGDRDLLIEALSPFGLTAPQAEALFRRACWPERTAKQL